jgi:hypothetical protein
VALATTHFRTFPPMALIYTSKGKTYKATIVPVAMFRYEFSSHKRGLRISENKRERDGKRELKKIIQ